LITQEADIGIARALSTISMSSSILALTSTGLSLP